MVVNIKWYPLNQEDNLRLTVDARSDKMIFAASKWLDKNERAFVRIYEDGFAHYGLEMQEDPYHNYERYTWSSNSESINEIFDLRNKGLTLARSNVGLYTLNGGSTCGFSVGILLDHLLKYAEANEEQLTYPFEKLYEYETGHHLDIVRPEVGMKLSDVVHRLNDGRNVYLETKIPHTWVTLEDLMEYRFKHHKGWCFGEMFNRTLD